MAVFSNTVPSSDIEVALGGSLTLATADVINIVEGNNNYDANLDVLGTTQFERFSTGPGYSGNVGDYPDGLLVVAKKIYIESASPLIAIKGDNLPGTNTELIVWKNRAGGQGSVSEYKDLTRLDLLASGTVNIKASTNVDNAYVKAGGLTALFEKGDDQIALLDVGVASVAGGTARVEVGRDVNVLTIKSRGEVMTHEDCSPTTINLDGGNLKHKGGAIGGINADGGLADFSMVTADVVISSWVITGDLIIIKPPTGLSVTMPTSTQQGSFRIDYRDAA
ncbi:hypothetical protein COB72_01915 [bacterium]|nr:MAG: hypothetical protein COB72_01915 [bacterium]